MRSIRSLSRLLISLLTLFLSGCFSPKAHDALLMHAFTPRLNPEAIGIMAQESRDFDKATQSTEECYKHSMASKKLPPAEARKKRDEFIKDQIEDARMLAKSRDCESALKSLAHALHTLMDSSSPKHTDKDGMPLVWNPWWPFGHSPSEWIGGETLADITPQMYKTQDRLLNEAFEQAFSGTPCEKQLARSEAK